MRRRQIDRFPIGNPTRQEIIDLAEYCRQRGRVLRSLKPGFRLWLNPRASRRVEELLACWRNHPPTAARTEAVLKELVLLSEWWPTRWDSTVELFGERHLAELVPVWSRLDWELSITHVVYLLGREPVPAGYELTLPDGRSFLTVVGHRYRKLLDRPYRWKGRTPGWYTELQCTCPVATAAKVVAVRAEVRS